MTEPDRARIEKLLRGEEFDGLDDLVALGARAVPVLVEIVRSHPKPYMRARAAVALGEIGDRQAIPVLRDALRSDDPQVRISALSAFASVAGADATETLSGLLNDPDPSVVKVAVTRLTAVGTATALAALEQVRSQSDQEFLRALAGEAIQAIETRIA